MEATDGELVSLYRRGDVDALNRLSVGVLEDERHRFRLLHLECDRLLLRTVLDHLVLARHGVSVGHDRQQEGILASAKGELVEAEFPARIGCRRKRILAIAVVWPPLLDGQYGNLGNRFAGGVHNLAFDVDWRAWGGLLCGGFHRE